MHHLLESPSINRLNAELNPICHLLALLGVQLIFHVSSIRVKWRYGDKPLKMLKAYYLYCIMQCQDGCAKFCCTLRRGGGRRWRSWLGHCATSRKVAGLNLDGVTGNFHWLIPWGRLSLQQNWIPAIFPGDKGRRFVRITSLPSSCADCLEILESQTPGTLRACPGL
jgi:hypothetical protein